MAVENEVRELYRALLDAWNRRDAKAMAALFAGRGSMIGFDGSMANGRAEIESHLAPIFRDHPTAAFVGIVREVRVLGESAAMLRAAAGMVPSGKSDINPAVNAIQTLIAARHGSTWKIEMFQNTPAAFHGRPELTEAMSAELRAALLE